MTAATFDYFSALAAELLRPLRGKQDGRGSNRDLSKCGTRADEYERQARLADAEKARTA